LLSLNVGKKLIKRDNIAVFCDQMTTSGSSSILIGRNVDRKTTQA